MISYCCVLLVCDTGVERKVSPPLIGPQKAINKEMIYVVYFCMKNQGCSSKDFFSIKIQKVMSKPHLMFKIFHALSKIENSLDFFRLIALRH